MIKAWIVGDKELVAKLDKFPSIARDLFRAVTQKLTIDLQAKVINEKLTGQVLHVRTGTLRRSINQEVQETKGGFTGIVGTNLNYAGYHEYGFTGTEQVREHLRMMTHAWGRPVREPRKIVVGAHARKVNYPEHSFLRSSLREMEPTIRDAYEKVAAALAKTVQ